MCYSYASIYVYDVVIAFTGLIQANSCNIRQMHLMLLLEATYCGMLRFGILYVNLYMCERKNLYS